LETDNEALATPVSAATLSPSGEVAVDDAHFTFPALEGENGEKLASTSTNGHHNPILTEEAHACIDDLLKEKAALEAMIQSESALLEEEVNLLLEEKAEIQSAADQVREIDRELEAIKSLTEQLK
jgi:hypothetical protein